MFLSLLRPTEAHHKDIHNEFLMSPLRSLDKPYQEPVNPSVSLLKRAAIFHLNARWKSGHGNLGSWGPWDFYDSWISWTNFFCTTRSTWITPELLTCLSNALCTAGNKSPPASMHLPCFSCQRSRCMTGRECLEKGFCSLVCRFQDQGSNCLCSVEMVIRKTWWLVIPKGYLRLTSRWGDPRTHEHMPGTNSHKCNQIPIRSINHQQLVNTLAPNI